jgi:murein DD-endopeptidase MepM/ murein hydrolase activator NlpD
VAAFARDSYINGNQLASDFLLLDSNGPAELIERAGLLESVAKNRTDALNRLEALRAVQDVADTVAEVALADKEEAEEATAAALAEAGAVLEVSKSTVSDLLEDKATLDAELFAALVELLGPEGAVAAQEAYREGQLAKDALEAAQRAAAAGGGPVLSGSWSVPVNGRFTSCFCQRWGTMHYGIDIAAPMFTPVYSVGDGVVVQSGAASGFGQAIYIQHSNGDGTVYGHMEVLYVTAGQTVAAGQQIAGVGSRGYSTGPHLHFEVHVGGMNGPRVDPVIWLADRGVFI